VVGSFYLPRAVSSSSALYGSLGVVFAILAWLAIGARLVVYCSAFNVVRHEQSHGTVTVEIQVPHIQGEVPLSVDRGGAVAEAAPAEDVEGAGDAATPDGDDSREDDDRDGTDAERPGVRPTGAGRPGAGAGPGSGDEDGTGLGGPAGPAAGSTPPATAPPRAADPTAAGRPDTAPPPARPLA
jgi:hypothetical protein